MDIVDRALRSIRANGKTFTPNDIRAILGELAERGQGGDTLIAHINPREAALLKRAGGSGKINPRTGLLAFEDEGGGGGGDAGDGDSGSFDSGSFADDVSANNDAMSSAIGDAMGGGGDGGGVGDSEPSGMAIGAAPSQSMAEPEDQADVSPYGFAANAFGNLSQNAPGVGFAGPTSLNEYTQNTSNAFPSAYAAPAVDPDIAANARAEQSAQQIEDQDRALGLSGTSPMGEQNPYGTLNAPANAWSPQQSVSLNMPFSEAIIPDQPAAAPQPSIGPYDFAVGKETNPAPAQSAGSLTSHADFGGPYGFAGLSSALAAPQAQTPEAPIDMQVMSEQQFNEMFPNSGAPPLTVHGGPARSSETATPLMNTGSSPSVTAALQAAANASRGPGVNASATAPSVGVTPGLVPQVSRNDAANFSGRSYSPETYSAPIETRSGLSPQTMQDQVSVARAILGEARNQDRAGQIGVANVIANRAQMVAPTRTQERQSLAGQAVAPAQFSWNASPSNQRAVGRAEAANSPAWQAAMDIAAGVISGRIPDNTGGATHYHTTAINPSWASGRTMSPTTTLGAHRFYQDTNWANRPVPPLNIPNPGYADGGAVDLTANEDPAKWLQFGAGQDAPAGLPIGQAVIGRAAKTAASGATLPGDVYAGRADPMSDEGFARVGDLSGLIMGGGGASAAATREAAGGLGIVPIPAAKRLTVFPSLPQTEAFEMAVRNTPGARINEGRLELPLVRGQRPEQHGAESVRGGVFYLPQGSPNARYYSGKGVNYSYGGPDKIKGETAISNPLFVKGATGGKAPESAYVQLKGADAFKELNDDVMSAVNMWHNKPLQREMVAEFLDKHAPDLSGMEQYIIENSSRGNQLRYALQEAAVGQAARAAGHDAIVGYSVSTKTREPFISEVFDVRENKYPSPSGAYEVWPEFERYADGGAVDRALDLTANEDPSKWLQFGAGEAAPAGLPIGQAVGTSAAKAAGEGLLSGAELTKRAMEGEMLNVGDPRVMEKALSAAGVGMTGGIAGTPAGGAVLGSGPVRQAVQTARELSPLGLYSHGAEAAAALQQAKGSPEQIIAQLRSAGVKPAELFSTGIADEASTNALRTKIESEMSPRIAQAEEALKSLMPGTKEFKDAERQLNNLKGTMRSEMDRALVVAPDWASRPSVTREEIAQHLREQMPVVEERVLGGKSTVEFTPEMERRLDDLTEKRISTGLTEEEMAEKNRLFLLQVEAQTGLSKTKFQEYTLPGGENYREVLLKSPNRQERNFAFEWFDPATQTSSRNTFLTQAEAQAAAPEGAIVAQREIAERNPVFKSLHWDDPNVLAHIRMSDRTGPNGEKILHVEELQSDWGQQGRKVGFSDPAAKVAAKEKMDQLSTKYDELGRERRLAEKEMRELPDYNDRFEQLQNRVSQIGQERDLLSDQMADLRATIKGDAIPPAPYVTSTEGWTDLALKRVLKEAAEGGYDRVVFTPGAEQAKRYDLSKQIDRLVYNPQLEILIAYKNGRQIINKVVPENELASTVGKDVAKNLMSSEGQTLPNAGPTKYHVLEGQDLSVGGEGMKAYYDKMVPKRLQELVRKHDKAAKVGKTDVLLPPEAGERGSNNPPIETMGITITPQMRESILRGQPHMAEGGAIIDRALSKIQSRRPAALCNHQGAAGTPVRSDTHV